MKHYKTLRRVQVSMHRIYYKHPAMAHRPMHFKIFVSALVLFSFIVLCSSLFIR